ncbi:MAG TPA: pyrimidine dimer DNA glycosylase/endonuclease V [Longimicrobiaceae bacterium]|nr:pyrimidine dimer DNA glycosylase/endonuclease V [Longimicrobiaceae bacterium]
MRIWTLHPRYLDPQGLVALWRETLLAQKVLQGRTRGYRAHPQLTRFRAQADPLAAVAAYLRAVQAEAARRGYRFDAARIASAGPAAPLEETRGQLLYEWTHLLRKLETRAPALHEAHREVAEPEPHPLFRIVPGPVAGWERTQTRP